MADRINRADVSLAEERGGDHIHDFATNDDDARKLGQGYETALITGWVLDNLVAGA